MKNSLRFYSGLIVTLFTVVMFLTGCGNKKKEIVIPFEDTVREQYLIADRQDKNARGVFDPEVRAEELKKAIRAFEVVEERFPSDTKYAPAAAVKIASLYADIEEFETAATGYLRALETYPEDTGVRVASLLGLGQALDEQGNYEEAKTYFKLLIDEHKSTTNPEYRQAVEQARSLYRQIR